MNNILHLFYIDKNRKKRWYMENYNLIIDFSKKQFKTYVNSFYWYTSKNDIETKKKSSILEYENLLEKTWFLRVYDF